MVYNGKYLGLGASEIAEGAGNWRLWHMLGTSELRRRYARSRIGQFWLTLSTLLSTIILGVIWSALWKVEPAKFLPHLTVSLIVWQLMSGLLSEASGVMPASKNLLLSQRLACSTLIFSTIHKHVLTFLHNLVVVALVLIAFQHSPDWQILLLPVALALFLGCAVWLCYLTAIACTRFRDLNYAMQTILQLGFYITPVIWKPEFLTEQYRWLLAFNPFASYMAIIRASILGEPFPTMEWILATAITIGGFLLALPVIGRYRRELLFWL